MAITSIRGKQIVDGSVQRADLDTTTAGQAVAAKVIQGTGITLSSTGADSGTGDVTVSSDPTTIWKGFIAKSAAYTLVTADSGKYVICTGGSWTLTLPAPALGLVFQVRNDMGISGTIGTITLQPTGGTIDGLASISLLPQQECTLITDGTNWRTLGLKREVILGTQDITSSTASGTILLPSGYRYFELAFTEFSPVTSPDYLAGQLSSDGGSTWLVTGYYHGINYNNSQTTTVFFAVENGTSFYLLPQTFGGSVSNPGIGKLMLFPGNPSQASNWLIDGFGRTGTTADVKWNGGGTSSTGGATINALKYFAASGNILRAHVTVKGVV